MRPRPRSPRPEVFSDWLAPETRKLANVPSGRSWRSAIVGLILTAILATIPGCASEEPRAPGEPNNARIDDTHPNEARLDVSPSLPARRRVGGVPIASRPRGLIPDGQDHALL